MTNPEPPELWTRYYQPGSPQYLMGSVNWPAWAEETREGGTYIVATVRAHGDEDPWLLAPNLDGAIDFNSGDVLVDHTGRATPTLLPARPPLLAVVVLGATNRIYRHTTTGEPGAPARYWRCTESELDHRGRSATAILSGLYRREPELLTFLDTYEAPEVQA